MRVAPRCRPRPPLPSPPPPPTPGAAAPAGRLRPLRAQPTAKGQIKRGGRCGVLLVDVCSFAVLCEVEADLLFLGSDPDPARPDNVHYLEYHNSDTKRVAD